MGLVSNTNSTRKLAPVDKSISPQYGLSSFLLRFNRRRLSRGQRTPIWICITAAIVIITVFIGNIAPRCVAQLSTQHTIAPNFFPKDRKYSDFLLLIYAELLHYYLYQSTSFKLSGF